jgi:hypothetical protein
MLKLYILLFLSFFLWTKKLHSVDDLFQFTKQSLPEIIEYETERTLCISMFNNKSRDEYLGYLESGIPSIISAGVSPIEKVFDPNVLPIKVFHAYGEQTQIKEKIPKFFNSQILEELNQGKREFLPEKDPRYIKLKTVILNDEINQNLANYQGKLNHCFYMILGSFERSSEDTLRIHSELFNFHTKTRKNFSLNTSLKRAYQEMNPFVEEIRNELINKELTHITVLAGEETNALVFLDKIYIGKTPLENKKVPVGKHKLVIQKEGFQIEERIINPKQKAVSTYNIAIFPPPKLSKLSVYSEPEGADVYIGTTLLGKTPIENVEVVHGLNRVKISKDSYIDHYRGVEFEKGKTFVVQAKLKEGDTKAYYNNRLNVFQDYSYYDFVNYSMSSIILFYLGYGYGQTKMSITSDNLRSQVMDKITFWSLLNTPNLSPDFMLNLYLYENSIVQENEKKVRAYRTIRNNSAVGGGVMLFMALGFFWFGSENEGVNFGFEQHNTFWGKDSLSSFYYTHRF